MTIKQARRISRRAAAVLAATLAIVIPASLPAQAFTTSTYDTWQWNVAGHTLHNGSTTDGMVAAAAASIVNRGSDLVGLTELCAGQYSALVTQLRDAGWPQDPANFARFQVMLPSGGASGKVCGGQDFGLALFSRVPLGGAQRVQLPEDGRDEDQYLLCAPLSGSTARACVTHITTALTLTTSGTPVNTAQLNAALTAVEARHDAGDTVLTLGDFNAQPNYGRIASWYALYNELDDTDTRCAGYGEWTATGTSGAPPKCSGGTTTCTTTATAGCSKIDLAFVRKDRIAGTYSADALAIPTTCPRVAATSAYAAGSCSDHRVLVGTVPVRLG